MKLFSKYLRTPVPGAALLLLLLAAACGEPQFKIKGNIDGADDTPVVLAKSDFHGRWIAVDSTRTSNSGSFTIERPAPAAPEIFRLEVNGRFIYLPVDSIETVVVETTLKDFGTDYTLSGSDKAETMALFDREVMAIPAAITPDSLASLKRGLFSRYLKDGTGSIVSYYALTKVIDGKPLFDPDTDYKYFAAVATGFKQTRPDDPRTQLLEKTAMEAMRRRNAANGTRLEITANELKAIDISLPDENGKTATLSDMLGKGKPTVVMFGLLTHPDAPAINVELSRMYGNGGFNLYQVSVDPDQYAWRDAARNLPWTTVYDADGEYSRTLRSYNVSTIPVFFIYNAAGELSNRAETIEELRSKL